MPRSKAWVGLASRVWTDAADWTTDAAFMERLDECVHDGSNQLFDCRKFTSAGKVGPAAASIANRVLEGIRKKRVLALMLGDTSMGMINGYFGPRLLYPIGFSEHKVDQAWIIDRVKTVSDARVEDAFKFVQDRGVAFHWNEPDADDFTSGGDKGTDTRLSCGPGSSLRVSCRLSVAGSISLGLLKLLPPSDFAEGLLNSHARPEGNGNVVITSTEADQGNLVPMELMKRLLELKQLPAAVMFHDVRWGARHNGRFLWVLLNSGSCGAYAFNHDTASLEGVHSYRQPSGYFPVPGRHVRRRQFARRDHVGTHVD